MLIDKRLIACAEFVDGKGTVCDIGTDHAYLVAYLIENKICRNAIAADINDGPINAAKSTITKAGISGNVKVLKSDGLDGISSENVSDIVIAGMGAELICNILSRCTWLKNGVNLILQPMTHMAVLREWLYQNGFSIVAEKPVIDDRHVYSVINAIYSGKSIFPSPYLCEIGMIRPVDQNSVAYIKKQQERLLKVVSQCENADIITEETQEKLIKYRKILLELQGIMEE